MLIIYPKLENNILGENSMQFVISCHWKNTINFLLSADVFIYGNWRQEAVGNILIALFIGGKVFLDEKNPLLKIL